MRSLSRLVEALVVGPPHADAIADRRLKMNALRDMEMGQLQLSINGSRILFFSSIGFTPPFYQQYR
jgi:hypothetical protein